MDRDTSETVVSDCVVFPFFLVHLILYSLSVVIIKELGHKIVFWTCRAEVACL